MGLRQNTFGKILNQEVTQFVLENNTGMVVKIMDYGATITSIVLPSIDGQLDVVCGFDSLEGYLSNDYKINNPYFGAVIGQNANRIKDGRFRIGDQQYQLALNHGKNHLHGGVRGFDKRIWKSKLVEEPNSVGVELSLFSEHLEEGYPGNIEIRVSYKLSDQNELHINYQAEADNVTPLTLTNHTYFNLSGFKEDVGSHEAVIRADNYLTKDSSDCPDGIVESVAGPLDFRIRKLFTEAFKELATGIDHYYVFNKPLWELEKVAEFKQSKYNIALEVHTNEPGMQIYTGYHVSSLLSRNKNNEYGPLKGFCCETQRYPNGVNIDHAPKSYTDSSEPFNSKTIYKFKYDRFKYEQA